MRRYKRKDEKFQSKFLVGDIGEPSFIYGFDCDSYWGSLNNYLEHIKIMEDRMEDIINSNLDYWDYDYDEEFDIMIYDIDKTCNTSEFFNCNGNCECCHFWY